MLFVHGLTSNASTWDSAKALLADELFGGELVVDYGAATDGSEDEVDPTGSAGCTPGSSCAADFFTMNFSDYNESPPSQNLSFRRQGYEISLIVAYITDAVPHKENLWIVAHSMGGLAARAYLQNLGQRTKQSSFVTYRGDVDRLVTIGTPHLGAPIANHCKELDTCFGFLTNIHHDSVAVCELAPASDALVEMNGTEESAPVNTLPADVEYYSIVVVGDSVLASSGEDGDGIVTASSQNLATVLDERGLRHRSNVGMQELRDLCDYKHDHRCETSNSAVLSVVRFAALSDDLSGFYELHEGPVVIRAEPPYCDIRFPEGPAVLLNWDRGGMVNPSNTTLIEYPVYHLFRNGEVYASDVLGTSFRNEINLEAGEDYEYYVEAVYPSGVVQETNRLSVSIPQDVCGVDNQTGAVGDPISGNPLVVTEYGSSEGENSVRLSGTFSSPQEELTVWFEYGDSDSYDSSTEEFDLGILPIPVFFHVQDELECSTTYHFRAVGRVPSGTFYGSQRLFRTAACDGSTPDPPPTGVLLSGVGPYCNTEGQVEVELSWDGSAYDDYFNIFEDSVVLNSQFSQTYHATDLNEGVHIFRVRAYNESGYSESNHVSIEVSPLLCTSNPIVSTDPATEVTENHVRLNMTVDPMGLSTVVSFVWEAGDPSPDANQTSAIVIGASFGEENFGYPVGGLACGTTYYFTAAASNAAGSSFGDVRSFTTSACGGVGESTELIRNGGFEEGNFGWVRNSSIYIDAQPCPFEGSSYSFLALPDGTPGDGLIGELYQPITIPADATSVELRYRYSSTTSDFDTVPRDVLSTFIYDAGRSTILDIVDTTSNLDSRNGCGSVFYDEAVFDLSHRAGETVLVYFLGTTDSDVGTPTVFRIDDVSVIATVPDSFAPDVVTNDATAIIENSALLNASVTPNGPNTTGWFEWGTSPSLGTQTIPETIGSGSSALSLSAPLSGLACSTIYYFRAFAQNGEGTSQGALETFMTAPCGAPSPFALSLDEIYCTSSGVISIRMAWTASAGAVSYEVFRNGTTLEETTNLFSDREAPENMTHTFVVRAIGAGGSTFSNVVDIAAPAFFCTSPPAVFTDQPTDLTQNNARLNGRVNPAGEPTTWWFRWGEGTNLDQATNPLSGGGGTVEIPISFAVITQCGTLYSYRAVAENQGGIVEGPLVAFSSPDCPPDAGPFSLSADVPRCHDDGYPVVDLAWTASENAFRYHLYRDSSPIRQNLQPTITTVTDGFDPVHEPSLALHPGSTYEYYATAQALDGADAVSNTVTVEIPMDVCDSTGVPTLAIELPASDGEIADQAYEFTWTADDPDSDARISFYYDTEPSGGDGTYIVSGLSEDHAATAFTWHTTFVPEGDYYIYGVIDDGENPPVTVYSEGTVAVSHQTPLTVCGSDCDYIDLDTAIAEASPGSRIHLAPGIYPTGQIYIDKDITLQGAGRGATILRPTTDTGTSGDSRGWFVIETGADVQIGDLTFDGSGHQIWQGLRHRGGGLVERVHFTDIGYHPSTSYRGTALVAYGDQGVDVLDASFERIGRVGVLFFGTGVSGSTMRNSTFIGKGDGDWLDYGIEVGSGAKVTIAGVTISDCRGVASIDGSTSAGIYVNTFFGDGSQVTVTGSAFLDSDDGITAGAGSTVIAHYNSFTGNATAIANAGELVSAEQNFWGHETGPTHASNGAGLGDPVSDDVVFEPFLEVWSEDIIIQSFSPVDLEVVVAGLVTRKGQLGIPLSTYEEGDFNSDDETNDRITIANAPAGLYQIIVRGDDTATPTDTYSLTLSSGSQHLVLASNALVPIGDAQTTVRKLPDGELMAVHEAQAPIVMGSFDEGAGNTVDLGSGLIGTLSGGVSWGLGQGGAGLLFNGSGFVLVPDDGVSPLDLPTALTVGLWVRPDALGGTQMLISKDDVYEFELGKVDDAAYDLRLGNVVAGAGATRLVEGQWQHLAVTWDGSTVRYYYNGEFDGEASFAGTLPITNSDVGIGARPSAESSGGPAFHFTGALDAVVLYGRALPAEEIMTLVAGTLSDVLPPVRSVETATLIFPPDATSASFLVMTDEVASCRFSETANVNLGSMEGTLETVDSMEHTLSVDNLAPGDLRLLFVRCADTFGNQNTTDLALQLGVGESGLQDGLLLHLPMDEGSGCTSFDLVGAHDGALMPSCPGEAPSWVDDEFGGLSFVGGYQDVVIEPSVELDSLSGVTVSAWVKHAPTTGNYVAIVDKRDTGADGFDLFFEPTSRLFARFNTATAVSSEVVADGTWHHVAATYDGVQIALYVDGILDSSVPAEVGTIETEGSLHIGRHFAGPDFSFTGTMDDVMLYERALSAIELLGLGGEREAHTTGNVLVFQPGPEGLDAWITNVFDYGDDYGVNDGKLQVGGWADWYHTLISFDINELPNEVSSVKLYLYCYSRGDQSTPVPMELDRVTEPWNENTGWHTPRPSSAFVSSLPAAIPESWYVIDITGEYQLWKSGEVENFGLQLRPTANNNRFNVFRSSDYVEIPEQRPKLVIVE